LGLEIIRIYLLLDFLTNKGAGKVKKKERDGTGLLERERRDWKEERRSTRLKA